MFYKINTKDMQTLSELSPQTMLMVSAGDLTAMTAKVVEQTITAMSSRKPSVPITPVQAAKFLGVDVSTLWRWDKDGYLKSRRTDGGKKYYLQADLDAIKEVQQ